MTIQALWTVSTSNRKTGPIPTQYVGATRSQTEASCDGCALAPWADGGCYAWTGNSSRGANSVRKAAARGKPADLPTVLQRTPRGARAVRLGAIGDPARLKREQLLQDIATARAAGLKVLGYTHHSAEEPRTGSLKHNILASCETMEQADAANAAGWLVALAGPDSAEGFITCPNYARPDVTCNRCRLCDVPTLRRTKARGIVFPAHGGGKKRLPMAGETR